MADLTVPLPLAEPASLGDSPPQVDAASDEGNPFNKKTDHLVNKVMEALNIAGVAFAVVNGDKTYSKVSSIQVSNPADDGRGTVSRTWRPKRRSPHPLFSVQVNF